MLKKTAKETVSAKKSTQEALSEKKSIAVNFPQKTYPRGTQIHGKNIEVNFMDKKSRGEKYIPALSEKMIRQ